MSMSETQIAAQRAIENFLGQHSSEAANTALSLTDSEVAEVLAAVADRHTARTEIKRVLAASYDRRQRIGEEATQIEMARRRLEVSARIVMERELKMPSDVSVLTAGQLTDEELQTLGKLESVGDVADQVGAVLLTARDRVGVFVPPQVVATEPFDVTGITDEVMGIDEPTELDESPTSTDSTGPSDSPPAVPTKKQRRNGK